MNTKSIVSSIIISVVVVILGFSIFGGKTTERIIERQVIGANPSQNEIVGSDTWTVNGVKHTYRKRNFLNSATTTPCSLPFPNGSSTPVFYSVSNGSGSSTAMIYDVSTSTTAYATSTSALNFVQQRSVAGGAWDRVFVDTATSTGATGLLNVYHSSAATTTYFVLKTGAGQSGYTIPTGSCQAEWISITE